MKAEVENTTAAEFLSTADPVNVVMLMSRPSNTGSLLQHNDKITTTQPSIHKLPPVSYTSANIKAHPNGHQSHLIISVSTRVALTVAE